MAENEEDDGVASAPRSEGGNGHGVAVPRARLGRGSRPVAAVKPAATALVAASAAGAPGPHHAAQLPLAERPTVSLLRSFSVASFRETPTWQRLQPLLREGGSYGLAGPRGAGKSWLMRMAVVQAQAEGGVGLYFPCPSQYDADSFLASLSDTLATEVHRHLARQGLLRRQARGRRRLAHEAAAIRERVRYADSLMVTSQQGITAGSRATAALSRSRQRSLSERPVTTAGLVHGFRSFAELIVTTTAAPVVIGIDELDKIDDPQAVRDLLRTIKGVFDVGTVTYLLSVSDEAAAALQLGAVRPGRDEFNSSFLQVIEVPPLDAGDARELLASRGLDNPGRLAEMLCLLAGGNRQELLRMAESGLAHAGRTGMALGAGIARALLAAEAAALLREIIRAPHPGHPRASGTTAKHGAWLALPSSGFDTEAAFVRSGRRCLGEELWTPQWQDEGWALAQPSWRRFLVRYFLAATVLGTADGGGALLGDDAIVADLRDVMIISSFDSDVARSLLAARFGADFASPYRPPT